MGTGANGAGAPLWTVGVDIGSVGVKAVLMRGSEWADRCVVPTGWNPGETGTDACARLLERNGLTRGDVARTVATGYGRNAVEADGRVTEISCHAVGAGFLFPPFSDAGAERGVRTILDIGGQDSKAIALDRGGNVVNFLMNDKCAAGTGRFLQNMAVMLGCTQLPDRKSVV